MPLAAKGAAALAPAASDRPLPAPRDPAGEASLAGQAVGVDREPQEREIGDPVTKASGRVAPAERAQFYPPPGLSGGKAIHYAWVERPSDGGEGADAEQPGIHGGSFSHRRNGGVPPPKKPACRGQQCLASSSQLDPAAVAVEQLRPERLLQAPYLLGEGGLGQLKTFCCAGEAQLLGHGDEVPKVPEVRVHSRPL